MKDNLNMYGFLIGSSLHANMLEPCAIKNTEGMKLSQSVGVTLRSFIPRLDVFLQLTKDEFHICSFLNASALQQKKLEFGIL